MKEFKPKDMKKMVEAGKTYEQTSVAKWKVIVEALESGNIDIAGRTLFHGIHNCGLCQKYGRHSLDCDDCPLAQRDAPCYVTGSLYECIVYFINHKDLDKALQYAKQLLKLLEEIANERV